MKSAVMLLLVYLTFTSSALDIDFGTGSGGEDWRILNDTVMGGRSRSNVVLKKNSLIFRDNGFIVFLTSVNSKNISLGTKLGFIF